MKQLKNRIIVQDNFFSKKMLNKIKIDLTHQKFINRFKIRNNTPYQKIYFNVDLKDTHPVVLETKKILKKKFNLNCFNINSHYFLSTKHKEATPHADHANEYNCLIYLQGANLLNSGTGFYDKINNTYHLNSHIGFKENRAIIFDSKIFHSSLQFNEGGGTRYCLANFINNK
jgi:hypothetical protein